MPWCARPTGACNARRKNMNRARKTRGKNKGKQWREFWSAVSSFFVRGTAGGMDPSAKSIVISTTNVTVYSPLASCVGNIELYGHGRDMEGGSTDSQCPSIGAGSARPFVAVPTVNDGIADLPPPAASLVLSHTLGPALRPDASSTWRKPAKAYMYSRKRKHRANVYRDKDCRICPHIPTMYATT